ncbi:MAG: hypothetical protein LBN40_05520 [Oscillospiraceae bacterium]|jgi:flagellar operon protein|nr:hypothetical protein [Oscillospiraceae bacterium]
MLLRDYLLLQNRPPAVGAGITAAGVSQPNEPTNENGNTFGDELAAKLSEGRGVAFSGHALKRIDSRGIDIDSGEKLERLNKGVELAAEKGSSDALVLVDNTAFIVSVRNNKVITTLDSNDLKGNVFTNIDSAVII